MANGSLSLRNAAIRYAAAQLVVAAHMANQEESTAADAALMRASRDLDIAAIEHAGRAVARDVGRKT